MWGILGSGFGLYGYLPALLAAGEPVVCLPERYRPTLDGRAELAVLRARVAFARDDDRLLAGIGALVVAQRPQDLPLRLAAALKYPALRLLVLEKPLGSTPACALELLKRIEDAGKTCRAGFTFRWAPWAATWRGAIMSGGPGQPWAVHWRFRAHHHQQSLHNWKRIPAQGGGALRFYGIHLIALLAEWGYTTAARSIVHEDGEGGAPAWQAEIVGPGLPPVHVAIDSDSPFTSFSIAPGRPPDEQEAEAPLHIGLGPFDQAVSPSPWPDMDRRCGYLHAMLTEPITDGPPGHTRLRAATTLWAEIEAITVALPLQRAPIEDSHARGPHPTIAAGTTILRHSP